MIPHPPEKHIITWRLLSSLSTDEELRVFDDMRRLYESAFPEESEREPREVWERALTSSRAGPYVLEFVVAVADARVAGGIALEYYPRTACGLLTFLFVAEEHRRQGIARGLLGRAIARLQELSRGRLRLVFAEAEDPERVTAGGIRSSIDPADRLAILDRLGARVVDIRYIQPALGPGQKPAEHLHLLLIVPGDVTSIDRSLLSAFLVEFYGTLGVGGPAAETLLAHAYADAPAGDQVPLKPVA